MIFRVQPFLCSAHDERNRSEEAIGWAKLLSTQHWVSATTKVITLKAKVFYPTGSSQQNTLRLTNRRKKADCTAGVIFSVPDEITGKCRKYNPAVQSAFLRLFNLKVIT